MLLRRDDPHAELIGVGFRRSVLRDDRPDDLFRVAVNENAVVHRNYSIHSHEPRCCNSRSADPASVDEFGDRRSFGVVEVLAADLGAARLNESGLLTSPARNDRWTTMPRFRAVSCSRTSPTHASATSASVAFMRMKSAMRRSSTAVERACLVAHDQRQASASIDRPFVQPGVHLRQSLEPIMPDTA
jgi:hypothetical protein